jgi:hypothetical protein
MIFEMEHFRGLHTCFIFDQVAEDDRIEFPSGETIFLWINYVLCVNKDYTHVRYIILFTWKVKTNTDSETIDHAFSRLTVMEKNMFRTGH